MILQFELDAWLEYRDAAIYSEQRFGLGEELVQAVESALAMIFFEQKETEGAEWRNRRASLRPETPRNFRDKSRSICAQLLSSLCYLLFKK